MAITNSTSERSATLIIYHHNHKRHRNTSGGSTECDGGQGHMAVNGKACLGCGRRMMMIVKFATEYNGVHLHRVNMDTYKPVFVPYRLQKMKGGVNAYNLVEALFDTYAEVMNVKDNAFESIRRYLIHHDDDKLEMDVLAEYFKMGRESERC